MAKNPLLHIVTVCMAIIICTAGTSSKAFVNDAGCQHRSTSGRDYRGIANIAMIGIPCQKWSDTHPNDHMFTEVGDHNFCRNPTGSLMDSVWCYLNKTDFVWDGCSVPFCPPLKVLDFSLDGDWYTDANGTYTHASLQKENFPPFFTICAAFMVEWWGRNCYTPQSPLFLILDNSYRKWLYVELFAAQNNTEYIIHLSGVEITVKKTSLFYPMHYVYFVQLVALY